MRRILPLLVVAAVPLLAPSAAQAECKLKYVYDPFQTGNNLRLECPPGSGPRTGSTKASKKPVSKAALRKLRYAPKASVSAAVQEDLIERLDLSEAAGDAERVQAAEAQVRSGDLVRQADAALRDEYRWSTTDLLDRYTQAYIGLWRLANDRGEPLPSIRNAVRRDLGRRLVKRGAHAWSDGRQQTLGERLSSMLVVTAGTLNAQQAAGDEDGVRRTRASAGQLARQPDMLGERLTGVRLGVDGIRSR